MSKHRHAHLIGEKPGNHRTQMILMIVFLVVWISDSFLFQVTTFLFNMNLIWLNVPLGVIILGISVYFMKTSHQDLFDTKVEGLTSKGIYGRVRHPMYIGTFLIYLGLAVITLSLASIVVWLIIFAYYNTLANYEENKLEEYFGDEYLEYKKNVRKWIPL